MSSSGVPAETASDVSSGSEYDEIPDFAHTDDSEPTAGSPLNRSYAFHARSASHIRSASTTSNVSSTSNASTASNTSTASNAKGKSKVKGAKGKVKALEEDLKAAGRPKTFHPDVLAFLMAAGLDEYTLNRGLETAERAIAQKKFFKKTIKLAANCFDFDEARLLRERAEGVAEEDDVCGKQKTPADINSFLGPAQAIEKARRDKFDGLVHKVSLPSASSVSPVLIMPCRELPVTLPAHLVQRKPR
jgi:hypothetical protein